MRTLDARAAEAIADPADVQGLWERLAPARAGLVTDDEGVLREQIALSRIPAPTGAEGARGAHVAARFRALGLHDVRVDDVGNVLGTRAGIEDVAPVVICAHLDTVFPDGADVSVRRDGCRLFGPGIVDNARGLAGMLALARTVDGHAVRTQRPIVFVATVGEEGGGDLRGAKHLFASLERMPACCIALDGAGDDRIVHRALGVRRFRVTYRGAGGHSWAAYGVPNPVHAAGAAAARLAALPLPRHPRTTLSVCRIGGGISVNSIPDEAWLEVDLRSSSAEVLAGCVADIRAAVHTAAREESSRRAPGTEPLSYDVAMIGDRPCGATPENHPLVRAATAVTRMIGRTPELVTASTDANVPISLGVPAIAIGAGGRGGGVHTPGEWYDNSDGSLGLARALAIVVASARLA
jgi:acetylornithine deacetylase/succinyl-diaminopimelate desuccinylase-like protein